MKLLALLILTIALASCTSDAGIWDQKNACWDKTHQARCYDE